MSAMLCTHAYVALVRAVQVCPHQDSWHHLTIHDQFGASSQAELLSTRVSCSSQYAYELTVPSSTWALISVKQVCMLQEMQMCMWMLHEM